MTEAALPLPVLASLLFTLMGPIGIIPIFASLTAGADARLRLRIALTAFLTATITLALAVFVGAGALAAAGTSPSSLIIGAGLILTLTALRSIFAVGGAASSGAPVPEPAATIGFAPIAIPGIVTPIGVATLIIFVSYFPATRDKVAIMGVAGFIMTLNLIAMLGAQWFMRVVGLAPLIVLGAVFGVLQVAMGIEMIVSGLMRSRLFA